MPKTETFDREEVLNKVTELFWEKGFNGTSMQDIVDATQLNRSSIYNSFGDKQKLFQQTLLFYQQHQQAGVLDGLEKLPAKEAIRKIFEAVLEAIDMKINHRGCFLTNSTTELASQDDQTNKFLKSNLEGLTSLLQSILERGKVSGELNPKLNVEQTALYLFSSIQGIRVTAMLVPAKESIQAVIDRSLKVL